MAMKNIAIELLVAALLAFGAGCDDAEDKVENAREEVGDFLDCSQICGEYESCVAKDDFDASKCIDDCQGWKESNAFTREHAEGCQNCVSDDACDSGNFQCRLQCTGITPLF